MLPLPDVVHFFTDELAGLGGRRLAFALIFSGALQSLLLGHIPFSHSDREGAQIG